MSVAALWSFLAESLTPVFAQYRGDLDELEISTKDDRTLLTEADLAVQKLIVEAIRSHEAGATIIAEEDEQIGAREDVLAADGTVWIIDPIDGTAEFVDRTRIEFCSVVCRLTNWRPTEAFVLAPELGLGGVVAVADAPARRITVNGRRVTAAPRSEDAPRSASVTRSKGTSRPEFDAAARRAGIDIKTRTTSQTLDMLRTAVDLTDSAPEATPFDLFWRRQQKVWDGAAGLCFGAAAALRACDEDGHDLPLGPTFLSASTPTFASTVLGTAAAVSWFLDRPR